MRIASILAAAALLIMAAMSATADLTDYQKGVEEGLKIGFFMGNLSGLSHCNIEAARSYYANINQYSNWLANIFDQNNTMLDIYRLNPLIFNDPANVANQVAYAEPRIGEYPAEAYYTATGTGPANSPALGWV
jgi:hypothetical protein